MKNSSAAPSRSQLPRLQLFLLLFAHPQANPRKRHRAMPVVR